MVHKFFNQCYIFISLLAGLSSQNSVVSEPVIAVPKGFIWGSALSEYQVSGADCCTDSNWSDWEQTLAHKSGNACQFWDKFKDDIVLMKELGIKSLRFSVEWCKIEPEEGVIDEQAIAHYHQLIDALNENGIVPMVTLHHFVHPAWFEKKGGFERQKNISYFTRFCQRAFEEYGSKVHLWCTINEPTIFAFQGYVRGVFPPGKTNLFTAWRVLRNLMQAHTDVYRSLKSMPFGQQAQIGLVHQYLVFEPYGTNILEMIPGFLFNRLVNDAVVEFLKTGTFKWFDIAGIAINAYQVDEGEPFFDFIGLNYYSHAVLKAQANILDPLVPACKDDEIMTDMPYGMYPQGFYNALMDLKEIGKPIYVTENGIADSKDDKRELFIKEYLKALERAIADGCDVRGYYYWSLLDNFEWDMGYGMRFGLYEVDFNTKERKLREGAKYYQAIATAGA